MQGSVSKLQNQHRLEIPPARQQNSPIKIRSLSQKKPVTHPRYPEATGNRYQGAEGHLELGE